MPAESPEGGVQLAVSPQPCQDRRLLENRYGFEQGPGHCLLPGGVPLSLMAPGPPATWATSNLQTHPRDVQL